MRLLAFSDIHNNLVAVRKLRAFEKNSFDAIVVAGDIGNESAADFFKILATFKCPVLYVYGNWDDELGYKASFGDHCFLMQSNVITIDNISFTGFSGCPTNWGKNPFYRKCARQARLDENEVLKLNRESIRKVLKKGKIDPRKCVIISHERLRRLSEEVPGALLHLFGHLHTFSDQTFKTTRYVNVAALDRPVSARPRGKAKWGKEDCRNFNAGNYAVIEIGSQDMKIRCVNLAHDYPDWIPLDDRRYNGIGWIPEEGRWTKASDPPLRQYEMSRSPRTAKSHAAA
jgi:predicted phosphodiesterase